MKLTNSQEEYLKTIYLLAKTEKEIRVTDIANKLKITKPSVNLAIRNLKELALLNYEAYGDITLTETGKKEARRILKRYDIVKMFLTDVLEIEKEKAEEEAKSMKHAISEETEEKLEKYIVKALKLEELECGYDMNKEKCRNCKRVTLHNQNRKQEKKG